MFVKFPGSRCLVVATCALMGVMTWSSIASANVLSDAGFDDTDTSGGDVAAGTSAAWDQFNDAFISSQSAPAFSPDNDLKIFGPFFDGGGAGVVQAAPGGASAGEVWQASAYAQNWSGDALGEGNFAVVKIEFLDAGNAVIGAVESSHIDNTLPQDTWTKFSAQGVAPVNTTGAQIVLVHVQLDPISGGSVFFDNASLAKVPEPTTIVMAGMGLIALAGYGTRRRR